MAKKKKQAKKKAPKKLNGRQKLAKTVAKQNAPPQKKKAPPAKKAAKAKPRMVRIYLGMPELVTVNETTGRSFNQQPVMIEQRDMAVLIAHGYIQDRGAGAEVRYVLPVALPVYTSAETDESA